MGFADRGIVPRAISAIYAEAGRAGSGDWWRVLWRLKARRMSKGNTTVVSFACTTTTLGYYRIKDGLNLKHRSTKETRTRPEQQSKQKVIMPRQLQDQRRTSPSSSPTFGPETGYVFFLCQGK